MENQVIFIVGIICSLWLLYSWINFTYPYIRHSNLQKYLINDAYAMVTGATDGIEKAIAIELANRGFNVILQKIPINCEQ